MKSYILSFAIIFMIFGKPVAGIAQATNRWWPTTGKVMLGGGHLSESTSKDFAKRLISLAGGPDALIVIIPTANPKANVGELRQWLLSEGAHNIVVLDTHSPQVANTDSFVKVLHSASAVFMTGGQSLILGNTYRGTLVERELKALLARGGLIAGDSAGSIAIGCIWLSWLPDPYGKRSDELSILPNVTVSPHANVARGFVVDEEVMKYLVAHPEITGIDIDEDTMLILGQGSAEVIGKGHVSILDAKKDKIKPVLRFTAGEYNNLQP